MNIYANIRLYVYINTHTHISSLYLLVFDIIFSTSKYSHFNICTEILLQVFINLN